MEFRALGRTGVKVSSLCLGCMMFGGKTAPTIRTPSSTARWMPESTFSTRRTSTAAAAAKRSPAKR